MPLPNRIAGLDMAETRAVFDVTAKNFQADVVERSRQVPVVVLFWADQLPPAKDARRVLETLAGAIRRQVRAGAVRRCARPVAGAVAARAGSAEHPRHPGRPARRSDGRSAGRTRAARDARPVDDDERRVDARATRRGAGVGRLRSRARDVAAGARGRAEQPGVQTRICRRAGSKRRSRSGAQRCSRRCRKARKGAIVR